MFVLYPVKLLLESVGELWCRQQTKVRFAWDVKFSERVGSSLSSFISKKPLSVCQGVGKLRRNV